MREFLEEIKTRVLIHDGSKGYMLQRLGLKGGECSESWNLTNKDAVREVYRAYLEAGSDVIQTNTFPGNRVHLSKYGLGDKTRDINYWGVKLAKEVAGDRAFVSASIGPTGMLFEPSGELSFQKAYEIFIEQVKAVAEGGADIINFETFTDLAELRAAYFAARDATNLPVICSLAYESNGRTLMGTDPFVAAAVMRSLGADMIGVNCSFGPEHMAGIVKGLYEAGGGWLSVKPNAGLPEVSEDKVIYNETPEHFAQLAASFVDNGARLLGGCCGTTPEFIRALKEKVSVLEPAPVRENPKGIITSSIRYIYADKLDADNVSRLDASANSEMLEALRNSDMSWVEDTALDIAAEGFDAVYVNVDAVCTSKELLSIVVDRLQWYVRDPIIIETKEAAALEMALRIYRGVAGVIIGDEAPDKAALSAVAEKYGSVITTIY
ncbi:MAG: homocysteine methyltransferase [Clostridiaceae bacterium]|jgi:5-methyltetrahydrofolate--homocysteine methyltransferase|nr:homocysteine methyltransferase [Clostridiaceae bacterium]